MSRLADEAAYFGAVEDGRQSAADELAELRAELLQVKGERDRYREAILWALGEGDSDFGEAKPDRPGRFWWREQLRKRAALHPATEAPK